MLATSATARDDPGDPLPGAGQEGAPHQRGEAADEQEDLRQEQERAHLHRLAPQERDDARGGRLDDGQQRPREDPDRERQREQQPGGDDLAAVQVLEADRGALLVAGEDALERPEEQRGGDEDAEQGHRGDGRDRDAAGEDLELGDEARQRGQPEGGEGADGEEAGEAGGGAGEAAEPLHLVGPGPLVQGADEEEERAGDQAVAHHLRHGAGDGDLPRGGAVARDEAGGPDRHHDVAHVVDRGVGDHPLEAGLGQRDERAVEHRDDADDDDDPRPRAPRVGEHRHRDPDEAVGAHLEQDGREHRGADRRGVRVGGREPRVEGDRRGLDGEADEDRGEDEPAREAATRQRHRRRELEHVERVRVGRDVEADEADEQRERPEEGVEEELERRAGGVLVAPAGDEEVHRDDRQVEEDEEEDEVGRHEQPEAHALEEEEQGRLQARPPGLAQRVDGAGEEDDGRHRDERQREPVDPDVVAAAHARDPRHLLVEREPPRGGGLVAGPDHGDEDHLDGGHGDPGPAGRGVAERRRRHEDDRREERKEHEDAEHVHLTVRRSRRAAARTATASR